MPTGNEISDKWYAPLLPDPEDPSSDAVTTRTNNSIMSYFVDAGSVHETQLGSYDPHKKEYTISFGVPARLTKNMVIPKGEKLTLLSGGGTNLKFGDDTKWNTSGTLTNNGTIEIQKESTLNMDGRAAWGSWEFQGWKLVNNGTIENYGFIRLNGTIENNSGGLINNNWNLLPHKGEAQGGEITLTYAGVINNKKGGVINIKWSTRIGMDMSTLNSKWTQFINEGEIFDFWRWQGGGEGGGEGSIYSVTNEISETLAEPPRLGLAGYTIDPWYSLLIGTDTYNNQLGTYDKENKVYKMISHQSFYISNLVIPKGEKLTISSAIFKFGGSWSSPFTMINNGTIEIGSGAEMQIYKASDSLPGTSRDKQWKLVNNGTIVIKNGGVLDNGGIIENNGTIELNGTIRTGSWKTKFFNSGTISNLEKIIYTDSNTIVNSAPISITTNNTLNILKHGDKYYIDKNKNNNYQEGEDKLIETVKHDDLIEQNITHLGKSYSSVLYIDEANLSNAQKRKLLSTNISIDDQKSAYSYFTSKLSEIKTDFSN